MEGRKKLKDNKSKIEKETKKKKWKEKRKFWKEVTIGFEEKENLYKNKN